jgi:predicted dehydrogenase
MYDRGGTLDPCPAHIAVIGGGRWARVLTEALCGLVPSSVEIIVCSVRNAPAMAEWAASLWPNGRVGVSDRWPDFQLGRSSAIIVVNAVRDHERAVEHALVAGIPVLVEKPIACTGVTARRLLDISIAKSVRFAPAHIFLFAQYLNEFSRRVASASGVRAVRIEWTDPREETRYGELKRYDASVPVFVDWLPHLLSVLRTLTPQLPTGYQRLCVRKGGADLEFDLVLGDIVCGVRLARNSDRRRRIVTVQTRSESEVGHVLQLDFSQEPGSINGQPTLTATDPDWISGPRPSELMLSAFLRWAAGGDPDPRLDLATGVQACMIADLMTPQYNTIVIHWLLDRLASANTDDEHIHYALSEALQRDTTVAVSTLEAQIARVRRVIADETGKQVLYTIAVSPDPVGLLIELAGH